jgi:hypothetical protein
MPANSLCPLCDSPAKIVSRNGRRSTWSCSSCELLFETTELIRDETRDQRFPILDCQDGRNG